MQRLSCQCGCESLSQTGELMAIWNGRPKTPKVLEAALRWRQECLLDDGGMFSS